MDALVAAYMGERRASEKKAKTDPPAYLLRCTECRNFEYLERAVRLSCKFCGSLATTLTPATLIN